jgi:hypothetical protein
MIKVLSDKVFAFDRGEKNAKGQLIRYKTVIGFCELPDWVADTDLFKLATKEGSLKPFSDSSKDEVKLKEQENEQLKKKLAALEEENLLLKGKQPKASKQKDSA